MRIFSGTLATETNTFAPMPTGLASYKERGYYAAGQHPDQMSFFAGPLWAARLRSKEGNKEGGRECGWTLVEGMVAAAQPSGITTRAAYETLRDELLADLRAALPVDIVLLGLPTSCSACAIACSRPTPASMPRSTRRWPNDRGPVVLADSADNAGGGAASDSTFILRRMVERGIGSAALGPDAASAALGPNIASAALGPLWDPLAVRIASEAGVGAKLRLRIGGKVSAMSGDPIDLDVEVLALATDLHQTGLGGMPMPMGDSALVRAAGGIDIVLASIRGQAMGTDLFTNLGCDLAGKKIVVVKSSQHFYASFAKVARKVIYVDAPGSVTLDLKTLPYRKIRRPKWPL